MTAWVLVSLGLLLLVGIAVAVGASLDTVSQRREWARLAQERRHRNENRTAKLEDRMCADCPLRNLL